MLTVELFGWLVGETDVVGRGVFGICIHRYHERTGVFSPDFAPHGTVGSFKFDAVIAYLYYCCSRLLRSNDSIPVHLDYRIVWLEIHVKHIVSEIRFDEIVSGRVVGQLPCAQIHDLERVACFEPQKIAFVYVEEYVCIVGAVAPDLVVEITVGMRSSDSSEISMMCRSWKQRRVLPG